MTSATITATRTTRNGKATITIDFGDGRTKDVGGARSTRAAAVIVTARNDVRNGTIGFYGARGDLAAAQQEAHRLATATTMRHRGETYAIVPFDFAAAIPVVDAD